MLGTPDYIAPEQTLDAQNADIRADIYSLGCTLYYLLTGGPPFMARACTNLAGAPFDGARPLNLVRPEVPVELAVVVGKMMAKERERRYQTPAEVAEALKPFFQPEGPGTGSPDGERSSPDIRLGTGLNRSGLPCAGGQGSCCRAGCGDAAE